jgi:DNA invertase Pin-like site-specific DNA recombinase
MKRVIELIRVSTKAQAGEDRASIPAQRAVNRRTAQSYDLEIVRSIEITDVSGAAVLMAPEMQQLLKLIADPQIHGVVTKEFSRLMRPENFSDYAMLQAFVDTKTILYLPDGPVDFNSKSGRLLGGIRALMAGNEISEMRERAWDAKEQKRREGKFPSSEICLPSDVGYDKEKGWYYKPDAEVTREAFRLFLSGVTSYYAIGKRLEVNPYTIRKKLTNPIYCGWRVIDEKRDTSAAARRVRFDGRQGDRPKIKRAPDEVIRVRVIDEPLITEEEFNRAQAIIAAKRVKHWRVKPDHVYQFTYNGFLTCAECGRIIYTKQHKSKRKKDSPDRHQKRYYVCTGRYKLKECQTSYMRHEVLDSQLDRLFSAYLTEKSFLSEVAGEMARRSRSEGGAARAARLAASVNGLRAQRERVLDTYFEGLITYEERDTRLAKIDSELRLADEALSRERPAPVVTADVLASIFAPFYEFEFLKRDDKRRLLSAAAADIRIADYKIAGLSVLLPSGRDDVSLTGKGSSRRRA